MKRSILLLPIGKTSKVTNQQEDYLDLMIKKPSFLHTGVLHLKSFVLEWKLATISNLYPSATQQVRCTIWLQMASTVEPVLVVKNGSHLLMVHWSPQRNCNKEGFNVLGTPEPKRARTRIGLIGNEQNDCLSPDSYLGFGGIGSANRRYTFLSRSAVWSMSPAPVATVEHAYLIMGRRK